MPQGAAISPILFNIMIPDFPENQRNKALLFTDDVTLYTQVKQPSDVETTLQPSKDELRKWSQK